MNKIKEFFKNKKANKKLVYNICLIVTILGLLFIVSGTSYALLSGSSSSDKEQIIKAGDVTIALSEYFENTNQKVSVMSDTDGLLQEETYSFNLKNIGDVPARYDVKLVNEVPSDYNEGVIDSKYVKIGIEINGEEHGPFTLEEANNILDSGIIYENELISYEIRIWLDENYEEELLEMEGYKGFFKISVEAEQSLQKKLDTSGANAPVLDEGMIPVYYDETEEVWKKADSTNTNETYKWYDYNNKMWANSVTVSSTNRSTYQNADLGTEIPMEDILTMQVWIPRYKYKVWNYNSDGTVTSEPQEIEIVFEEGTASTGDITCTDTISGTDGAKSESCKINNAECTDSTCNNKYYTHPAFTFGTEELEGFWIGKFELTGTISNITTKPDLSSLRNQRVGDFSSNIMKTNDSGNQYGFNTSTDTHMIKNMEWGAVAYLSHSKYGTCTDGACQEIGINNNSSRITGCGAEAGSSSSSTCNSYNTELGMQASTTHNIYGVYDMSGGAYDYVMGNIVSNNGSTMMSGYSSSSNSGYTGIIYDGGNYTSYTGTYSYPDMKYYDKYSYGTSYSQRIRSKLGDGIKEVYNTSSRGWYSDYSYLANSSRPWFHRGGRYNIGSNAGAFYSDYSYGYANTDYSSRLVITP